MSPARGDGVGLEIRIRARQPLRTSGNKGVVEDPNRSTESREGEKQKITLPSVLSMCLHAGILVLLGGAVLVPGIIPKAPFVGEMVVPSAFETPEEAPVDDFLVENPVEVETPTLEVPDVLSLSPGPSEQTFDVVAAAVPMSLPSFSLPVGTGVAGLERSGADMSRVAGTSSELFSVPMGKRSSVQFSGIRAESQRVAFLLDASGSMVTEQRGGRSGHERSKQELVRMVEGLDATSEFNVFIFDQDVDAFRPKAVAATEANKQAFA